MKLELQKGSRSRILAALVIGAMALFLIRLFYLQIIQHSYYVALANNEQVKRLTIPAKRGVLYALDNGKPVQLVMNETVYTLFADPYTVTDSAKAIDVIRQVAGGNARPNLQELISKKDTRYQILATKLTRTQADKIKQQNIVGIGFQAISQRVYPEGSLAAQVLGFVNNEGSGQYGIEQALNSNLTGKDGLLQSVTDVSNVPLTIGNSNINRPAINGKNIVLSVDRNIQSHTEEALAAGLKQSGATEGSVLVMDPQTGKVMAMANLPTFNPATYTTVQDARDFSNATISMPYEPGSDVKTLTFATAIDKGVLTPESTYNNTDYITVEDRVISNATKGQTGIITFQHALNFSLNTGFVTVAERLGDGTINLNARNTIYDYFHNRFGLGSLTGVELTGESEGTVISPDQAEGNAVRYSNMAFGQGLDATMIQVGGAFSSIINGGNYYRPTVLAGVVDSQGKYVPSQTPTALRRTISKATSDTMVQAIQTARATLFSVKDKPGYKIGGKTGTSQVVVNGVYSNTETVGTYLGFGGDDTPKYVIMVQVSGKNLELQGGRDAQPIFTDISNWMLDYLKLQPKG